MRKRVGAGRSGFRGGYRELPRVSGRFWSRFRSGLRVPDRFRRGFRNGFHFPLNSHLWPPCAFGATTCFFPRVFIGKGRERRSWMREVFLRRCARTRSGPAHPLPLATKTKNQMKGKQTRPSQSSFTQREPWRIKWTRWLRRRRSLLSLSRDISSRLSSSCAVGFATL